MINWIKKLITMVSNYDRDLAELRGSLSTAEVTALTAVNSAKNSERFIRSCTDVSVDVGVRGPNTIIVTGRYKNNDYVRIFDLPDTSMGDLIGILNDMKKHHAIRSIDSPPQMNIVFERVKNGKF